MHTDLLMQSRIARTAVGVIVGLVIGACGSGPAEITTYNGEAAIPGPSATDAATDQFGRPTDCPADRLSRASFEEAPLPDDIDGMSALSHLVVLVTARDARVTEMTVPQGQPQPFAGPAQTETTLHVLEALRGEAPKELVLTQMGDRCTVGVPPLVQPGHTYVVFLFQARPGLHYQLGRSAIFEVKGDAATTIDPTVTRQTFHLDDLRTRVKAIDTNGTKVAPASG